jgi:hypothetical protein
VALPGRVSWPARSSTPAIAVPNPAQPGFSTASVARRLPQPPSSRFHREIITYDTTDITKTKPTEISLKPTHVIFQRILSAPSRPKQYLHYTCRPVKNDTENLPAISATSSSYCRTSDDWHAAAASIGGQQRQYVLGNFSRHGGRALALSC